jgi:hypothetical protein
MGPVGDVEDVENDAGDLRVGEEVRVGALDDVPRPVDVPGPVPDDDRLVRVFQSGSETGRELLDVVGVNEIDRRLYGVEVVARSARVELERARTEVQRRAVRGEDACQRVGAVHERDETTTGDGIGCASFRHGVVDHVESGHR